MKNRHLSFSVSVLLLSLLFLAGNAIAEQPAAEPPIAVKPTTTREEVNTVKSGVQVGDIYVACKYYFSKLFNTRENVSRKNICNGYFFGSASMLLLLQSEGVKTATCIPMDVSTEEIIRGFLDWSDKNQDKNKLLASEALLQIIRQNYPCREFINPKPKVP